MPSSSSPPKPSGLSAFGNLLNPNAPSTISSGPMAAPRPLDPLEAQREKDASKLNRSAALKFAPPLRRPQVQQKGKKPQGSRPVIARSSSPSAEVDSAAAKKSKTTASHVQSAQQKTFESWAREVDDYDFELPRHERGGSRRKKKKLQQQAAQEQDWDAIYDPARPTEVHLYKGSEEETQDIEDWKNLLYRKRLTARQESVSEEEPTYRPRAEFAPPSNINADPIQPRAPDDPTGDDAYLRRLQMSQPQIQHPVSHDGQSPPPPPPPPSDDAPKPPGIYSSAPVIYSKSSTTDQDEANNSQLDVYSSAPVTYENPPPDQLEPDRMDVDEPPDRPSLRKKDFGKKMLEKMGWKKGEGLGANGEGIINPISMVVQKRKKLPDAKGGGFAGPAIGKIVGGKKQKGKESEGKFGAESVVIKLSGILDGVQDIEEELGELTQEIGELCNRFGNVERVFIHRSSTADSKPVFIKFVQQISALNAVNNLDNQNFRGNTIRTRYFDAEKFENGDYDE